MEENEVSHLYRVWKTVTEMMSDREYIVLNEHKEITIEEFTAKYIKRNNLTMILPHKSNTNDKVLVIFHEPKEKGKINLNDIGEYGKIMMEQQASNTLLISKVSLTPQAKKGIEEFNSGCEGKYHFEFWDEKELVVNITKHKLVPKHSILPAEAKKLLLVRYKVNESQLPKIQLSDPVAKYFGVKRGQVMKIIRVSETAGKYVTYRIAT